MDAETKDQIAALKLHSGRPLLICDVDEVALHFVRGFEEWLERHDLWLDPTSYEFEGNVRKKDTNGAISNSRLEWLLRDFFASRIGGLDPIDMAAHALADLSGRAQIVMLTNLPHAYHAPRRANLARHGMDYPLITNTGPKGPAVRALSAMSARKSIFIDDHPDFLESARAHAPRTALVHFLHDPRFAPHARRITGRHARVTDWRQASEAIMAALEGMEDDAP